MTEFGGSDGDEAKTATSNVRVAPRAMVSPPTRRGLSRIEAASYIGVSASKFDQMIADARMPAPKRIDGRRVWDVHAVDIAFDALPGDRADERNEWDDVHDA